MRFLLDRLIDKSRCGHVAHSDDLFVMDWKIESLGCVPILGWADSPCRHVVFNSVRVCEAVDYLCGGLSLVHMLAYLVSGLNEGLLCV